MQGYYLAVHILAHVILRCNIQRRIILLLTYEYNVHAYMLKTVLYIAGIQLLSFIKRTNCNHLMCKVQGTNTI